MANEPWNTSVPDWERRLLAGESLVPDLPLNEAEAEQGEWFFKNLCLPDVRGTPELGEIGKPWIFDIVRALFGSYFPELDRRFIQEVFLLVAKKNGKSTFAAAIMLTAILVNRRPDAEFNLIAPTIEVAGISFRQVRGMIKIDPELSKIFQISEHTRRITHRKTNAIMQIKAADVDVVTGGKPVGTLIDETHVFAGKSHASDIFVEIRGALAARPDGFLIQITTQSKAPPAGVFKSELARARDVRDGKLFLPKPLLAVLYELPYAMRDQWRDEKNWPLVNPNLGASVDIDFLRSGLIDAERKDRGELALFASQHFNVEIGLALRSDRWAGADFWSKQVDRSITIDALLERSETIVVGLDGGGLDDLFGLALLGRSKADPTNWLCYSHAWCHEVVLSKRPIIASTLRDFEGRGELTIVSDELDDIDQIIDIIVRIKDAGLLATVSVDPAGLGELIDALAAVQITPENKKVVGAPQGYRMMNAIKTTERKLANGTLWHSDSALMAWNISNCRIEPTATAIRMTKANAGDLKIDCAMALFDAVTAMAQAPARAPDYQMMILA
jgi:phage terminase large subunit-like protein